MPKGMRWVGLDVHAHASTLAVFDDVSGEVVTRRVNGRPIEALDALRGVPRPMRAVYEAGPTGYVTFVVDDLDAVLSDVRDHGAELVGEVQNYQNVDKLCFIRGPAGIIVELAERIG